MSVELKKMESLLRDVRPPDQDVSKERLATWSRLVALQRRRRMQKKFLGLPPWGWTYLSLIVIILSIFLMLVVFR